MKIIEFQIDKNRVVLKKLYNAIYYSKQLNVFQWGAVLHWDNDHLGLEQNIPYTSYCFSWQ